MARLKLGEILLQQGVITDTQLKKAIAIAREKYEDKKLLNKDDDKDGE